MKKWIDKFYYNLLYCKNRGRCMENSDIKPDDVFFPIPPKVFGINPKIIFFAMEPSSSFALNNEDALNQVSKGVRCFWYHLGDFTLHFSAKTALTEIFGEKFSSDYYITNIAKCALKVEQAKINPNSRRKYCQNILKQELEYIIKNRSKNDYPIFISVGSEPKKWISKNPMAISTKDGNFVLQVKDSVYHYSKGKLHLNLPKLLLKNEWLNEKWKSELSATKEKLYNFVKREIALSPTGTDKALKEANNDYYLAKYSQLAIAYIGIIKRIFDKNDKKI